MPYQPAATRYQAMLYRRCGRSGLRLPAVSLGLWHSFGEGASLESVRGLLFRAFDLGITHFDLANNYGPPPGAAEETLGRILTTDLAAHRDELLLSTKAGYPMWPGPYGDGGSRKDLLASLDQSLRRLRTDYVDIFYSHRFDPDTPLEETMGALASAVQRGKALYVGVSSYSARKTAEAAAILRGLGVPCLLHQPSYSMLNRWIEAELLTVLGREGIGCLAFSPLAQELTPYTHVSRKHAELLVYGDGVWIRDLGSRNGTFVNNDEVPKGQAYLIDGESIIRFGPFLAVSLKIVG